MLISPSLWPCLSPSGGGGHNYFLSLSVLFLSLSPFCLPFISSFIHPVTVKNLPICQPLCPGQRIQFSSVAQSCLCLTLCNPMNRSTPGLPVHHQILESTQTHVHRVGDPIQPSHPLSFSSPPALNLSQHRGLFQWIGSSHPVTKVASFAYWSMDIWVVSTF